jgi:hypothetical protein
MDTETKIDTLCNKTADPSGTTNSDSPSKETDTEGGNTEHESNPHTTSAVRLRHEITNLKTKSDKMLIDIETLRKNDKETELDLLIGHRQTIKEQEDKIKKFKSSIDEKTEEYEELIGKARTAGEPPMLVTRSRYAVRIPR